MSVVVTQSEYISESDIALKQLNELEVLSLFCFFASFDTASRLHVEYALHACVHVVCFCDC